MMKTLLVAFVMTAVLGLTSFAVAEDEKPDGTLSFSGGSVALGIGFSWGGGELTYKGEKHAFSTKGLSVVDVGITSADASGQVYNLKKLEDFPGNYTAVSAGATAAGGGGVARMKNQNGVVIAAKSTTQGASLSLAVEGVKVTLD